MLLSLRGGLLNCMRKGNGPMPAPQNLRLGNLFANIGNRTMNFGRRLGSTITKLAPRALSLGKTIAGGLSNLPGTIGLAASVIHKGMDYANKAINSLPESKFKEKLQTLEKSGADTINKIESRANTVGNTAASLGNSVNRVINSGPLM